MTKKKKRKKPSIWDLMTRDTKEELIGKIALIEWEDAHFTDMDFNPITTDNIDEFGLLKVNTVGLILKVDKKKIIITSFWFPYCKLIDNQKEEYRCILAIPKGTITKITILEAKT